MATLAVPSLPVNGTVPATADAQRCVAAQELLRRWGPVSRMAERQRRDASWRYWNADDVAAVQAVARQANALLNVKHAACAAARPAAR